MALERLLYLAAPDRVACDVEVVEDEAADRRERLATVASSEPWRPPVRAMRRPSQSSSSITGRASRPSGAEGLLVLGLAEDGYVPRHEPRARLVEVVLVQMRDDDSVQAA